MKLSKIISLVKTKQTYCVLISADSGSYEYPPRSFGRYPPISLKYSSSYAFKIPQNRRIGQVRGAEDHT